MSDILKDTAFEQLSIADILNMSNDAGNILSSKELEAAIGKLQEWQARAKHREMRKGSIRVLIGSTFKLGLGVNVQDKLIAIHHLDVPWRPADMTQREGRILRQGNENKNVEIYRYITEGSFDTKQLAEDINDYYKRLDICDVASMTQIQRVLLGGDRFDFSVICQIAFYLGMDVETLTNPMLTVAQIAQEQSTHYMTDRPAIDWAVYDAETAPILERVARSIYDGTASETGRPERVSQKIIYREMGFPGHRLENLPLCKAVFDKYTETYEENWARRIVWGYAKLKANNAPFYWSDIRSITGVKKKNIEKVIPHIRKYTNRKTAEAIINLVGGA